jgi:hypothetical protein
MSELSLGAAFGVLLERLRGLTTDERRSADLKWVRSNRTGYGSFVWCCDLIGLDIEAARDILLATRKERLKDMILRFEAELVTE